LKEEAEVTMIEREKWNAELDTLLAGRDPTDTVQGEGSTDTNPTGVADHIPDHLCRTLRDSTSKMLLEINEILPRSEADALEQKKAAQKELEMLEAAIAKRRADNDAKYMDKEIKKRWRCTAVLLY
jgi:hypothetical protein